MVVEIIAGRLIARYVGVSLYTWTSVIGVVLAGISLGNYFGGRVADKFDSRKALSLLFILASISCALVPSLNNLMGCTFIPIAFTWPVRITIHVAMIFFLPSILLGMISPVVAKFALDQGAKTGSTIGNVYAFSAGGSIAGTFIAGFFLIGTIGSVAIVWTIAAILAVLAIFYNSGNRVCRVWLLMLIFLIFVSFTPAGWARPIAVNLLLVNPEEAQYIYAKDTAYSYVRILESKTEPGVYDFKLDDLRQTSMKIDEPLNLEHGYKYQTTFLNIVEQLRVPEKKLTLLNLGGGGYLFPRYLEKKWPGSHIEVVEIDPGVTRAAKQAFGLPKTSEIKIHHMDARNYIDDLAMRKARGEEVPLYDFIFCDVVTGSIAVPFQLTTHEFNENVAELLRPEGIFVIHTIDANDSYEFLCAVVATLKRTFKHTYVLNSSSKDQGVPINRRETYVVIASQRKLDKGMFNPPLFNARLVGEKELESKKRVSRNIILTDDFAPVENLLTEAFYHQGEFKIYVKIIQKGIECFRQGRLEDAARQFGKAMRFNPQFIGAHINMASVRARQKRYDEAISCYNKALRIDPVSTQALTGLAMVLELKGRVSEAIEIYKRVIESAPQNPYVHVGLGNAFYRQGKLDDALLHYYRAVEIEPTLEIAAANLELLLKEKIKETK